MNSYHELEVFRYSAEHIDQFQYLRPKELPALLSPDSTLWVNMEGDDEECLNGLVDAFGLHPLLVEGLNDFSQSPRMEEYDDHMFISMKMLTHNPKSGRIFTEHINVVIGRNFLLTFQEGLEGDVFNPIRERLKRANTRIRMNGPDYLAYAIMDVIIDNYILIIEMFGGRIEKLESRFLKDAQDPLSEIYEYKMQINYLRKIIRPVREVAVLIEKSDSVVIADTTLPYLNNLVNHMAHSTEAIETYQIMLNDQLFLYQTRISNRLNDILRILTIFSVVFIPLTFIAGVYGTNFEHFPELQYKYAYPVFWGVMIATALTMLYYFRKKKWI